MKALPQAPNAERGILGALMRDPSLMGRVLAAIQPQDMWRPEHRRLLKLMVGRAQEGRAIDSSTLVDAIAVSETMDRYGGVGRVLGHENACPSVLALDVWLREVRDTSDRRKVVDLAQTIEAAASHGEPLGDLVSTLAGVHAGMGVQSAPARAFGEIYRDVLDDLQAESEGRSDCSTMSTGWVGIDKLIGGFRPGEFTVFAGRPSMGKTAWVLNAALQQSDQGRRVLVFSMEMSSNSLIRRCVATVGQILGDRLMRPSLMDQSDWQRATDALDYTDKVSIVVEEGQRLTAEQVCAKARAHAVKGLDLVVIDHLGEMKYGKADRHDIAVGDTAATLKRMGKELNCHVVLLQQLNRGVESRADKRPMQSDLRDSGRVEELADNILFIYREAKYAPTSDNTHDCEIIVSKCRMGRTGTAHLHWDGALQLITEETDITAFGGPYAAK